MAAYDLVVRNAMIVDGTRAAPFAADIAISSGKIMATGRFTGEGDEEIEAAHQYVTPGLVDIHTHYDGQVTWETRLSPSSNHGVTMPVMGNCGVGFAPIRQDQHEMAVALMEGIEDIPGAVMAENCPGTERAFRNISMPSSSAIPMSISRRSCRIDRCACSSWVSGALIWSRPRNMTWPSCGG